MRRSVFAAVPVTAALAAAALGARLVRIAWGVPVAIGAPRRRIAARAKGGSTFDGRTFTNRLPSSMVAPGSTGAMLREFTRKTGSKPARPVPVGAGTVPEQAGDLAITWLGHASVLIELDGERVLADPVWSDRVSPSASVGPHRLHPVPPGVDQLPRLTAVIISHDHYDHLDLPTIRRLVATQTAPFVVPLGIGAHLQRWGVPVERIVELDWDGSVRVGGLTLTCTEARHFSGRGLRRDSTLWSSWALTGPRHRVFFGGDSGYTPAFAEIGARLGPFDVTLLPIGAYAPQWPDIHMDPEQAWRAHGDLGGHLLVPIHWGTFDLAFHRWAEPVERLLTVAQHARDLDRSTVGAGSTTGPAAVADSEDELRLPVVVPRPGDRFDALHPPVTQPWWRELI